MYKCRENFYYYMHKFSRHSNQFILRSFSIEKVPYKKLDGSPGHGNGRGKRNFLHKNWRGD